MLFQIKGDLCPVGFCIGSRPFCFGTQCLPRCPDNYYNYNFNCVRQCYKDQPYTVDKNCSPQCPPRRYLHVRDCVEKCPYDFYVYDKTCVHVCPSGNPLVYNKTCVSRCPPEQVIDGFHCSTSCSNGRLLQIDNRKCLNYCSIGYKTFNSTCVRTCPIDYPYQLNKMNRYTGHTDLHMNKERQVTLCVSLCPNTTAVSNSSHECQLTCPEYHVLFNQTCVKDCPASHRLLVKQESIYNTMIMCVKQCPFDFLLDDRSCVKRCPGDKVVNNMTCTFSCSNDTLVCKWSNCQHDTRLGNTHCVSNCPQNHGIYEEECVRYCHMTPNKYILDGNCVDMCPFNLSIGDERQCVNKCPANNVISEGSCLHVCPDNTMLVDGVCYKNCPDSFPYKHVYFTKQRNDYWSFRKVRHMECRSSCPDENFYSDKECVSVCHSKLSFNKTCIERCPDSHAVIYTTIGKPVSTCLEEKPSHAVFFNGTYYNRCPNQANYDHNNTCLYSCPADVEYYEYANNSAVHCLTKCPENTLVLNMTCVPKCPPNYWTVNRSYCAGKCPATYPIIFIEPLYKETIYNCLDKCPRGMVVANRSCVPYCPTGSLLFEDLCVEVCPDGYNFVVLVEKLTRRFNTHSFSYYNSITDYFYKEAKLCASDCFGENFKLPCVRESGKKYILNASCEDSMPMAYRSDQFKLEAGCAISRIYNTSGIFVVNCYKDEFLNDKNCVKNCPANRMLYDPKQRVCLHKCPHNLVAYRNQCSQYCPSHTSYILDSMCLNRCPDDMPYRLSVEMKNQRGVRKGTLCLHECPEKYFVDGAMCKETCPKMKFKRFCVSKCPSSHPFRSSDDIINKKYTCLDYCPKLKVGDMATHTCIYKSACKGYQYDKKCYKECPPWTFNITHPTDSYKHCGDISVQQAAIGICVGIIFVMVTAFCFWCCTEKRVLCITKSSSDTPSKVMYSFVGVFKERVCYLLFYE